MMIRLLQERSLLAWSLWVIVTSYAAFSRADEYVFATPAVEAKWQPRMAFMTDAPARPMHALVKRQGSSMITVPAECATANEYPCFAIGVQACCANSEYCYIDTSGDGRCCLSELQCANDPCSSDSYLCSPSATTSSCCKRPCGVTAFQCAASYGGMCCDIGSVCLPSNSCSSTSGSSSSAINLCESGYTSCGSSLGNGCCLSGSVCTSLNGEQICSAPNGGAASSLTSQFFGAIPSAATTGSLTLTSSNTSAITEATGTAHQVEGGLSTGAKAGIGIGAGLAALALILLLFLLWRRKRKPANVVPPAMGYANGAATPGPMYPPSNQPPNTASYLQSGEAYSPSGEAYSAQGSDSVYNGGQYPFTQPMSCSPGSPYESVVSSAAATAGAGQIAQSYFQNAPVSGGASSEVRPNRGDVSPTANLPVPSDQIGRIGNTGVHELST